MGRELPRSLWEPQGREEDVWLGLSPAAPADLSPNSRLQRDLTKLDNPKGRAHTWPCLPGPAPPSPPPFLSICLCLPLFSSVFLSLYGLCFLVFHSDKCNMNGKEAPSGPRGQG